MNSAFTALEYVPVLVDGDNNNDVAAISAIAQTLVGATQRTMSTLTTGLIAQTQGMQARIEASAGGMARSAGALCVAISLIMAYVGCLEVSHYWQAMFECAHALLEDQIAACPVEGLRFWGPGCSVCSSITVVCWVMLTRRAATVEAFSESAGEE